MQTAAWLLVAVVLIVAAATFLRRPKPTLALQPGDLDLLLKLPQQIRPGSVSLNLQRLWNAGLVETVDVEGDFNTSYLFVLSDRGKEALAARL
jgi:hypothetical protein